MGAGDRQPAVPTRGPTICGPLPVQPCCDVSQPRHGCRGAAFCARPDNQGDLFSPHLFVSAQREKLSGFWGCAIFWCSNSYKLIRMTRISCSYFLFELDWGHLSVWYDLTTFFVSISCHNYLLGDVISHILTLSPLPQHVHAVPDPKIIKTSRSLNISGDWGQRLWRFLSRRVRRSLWLRAKQHGGWGPGGWWVPEAPAHAAGLPPCGPHRYHRSLSVLQHTVRAFMRGEDAVCTEVGLMLARKLPDKRKRNSSDAERLV